VGQGGLADAWSNLGQRDGLGFGSNESMSYSVCSLRAGVLWHLIVFSG
jgi:hypothetical protein